MKPLVTILLILVFSNGLFAQPVIQQKFICPPCGCNSDGKKFDKIGTCPGCGMNLVGEIDPSEGYPYSNIYPADVCKLDREEWIFLDVRTEKEFKGKLGHLNDAVLINVEELEDRLDELEAYKDKPVLVYCLISIRSMRASQLLAEKGFTKVSNMLGGMDMWENLKIEDLPCKEKMRTIE